MNHVSVAFFAFGFSKMVQFTLKWLYQTLHRRLRIGKIKRTPRGIPHVGDDGVKVTGVFGGDFQFYLDVGLREFIAGGPRPILGGEGCMDKILELLQARRLTRQNNRATMKA